MSKLNPRAIARHFSKIRLAGGAGQRAAAQEPEALLRRAVMASLLWEDLAYESGKANAENIASLIPKVAPETVASIAIEARNDQKLRHTPLFITREMLRHETHRKLVAGVLTAVCTRPDMLTDFLALYWKENKDAPLAKQVKTGLAEALLRFDEYQLAKWNRDGEVKLRDVMFLTHPKPVTQAQTDLLKKLADKTLATPDTWEVALSTGKDKKETWERLINDRKLPALAFLRNLSNMNKAGVDRKVVYKGFEQLKSQWLLPLNFFAAAQAAPEFVGEIEQAMLNTYSSQQKLPGWTVFVVDVSGSMRQKISAKSTFDRFSAAAAMAVLAQERAEHCTVYATAGSDPAKGHATAKVSGFRGFGLVKELEQYTHGHSKSLGGGGIFTRQCLEWIKNDLKNETPDRIIVFSDSQDCDYANKRLPAPFGVKNYIVDVSAHAHGINYDGVWTAEVSGWSEKFVDYICALEGVQVAEDQGEID